MKNGTSSVCISVTREKLEDIFHIYGTDILDIQMFQNQTIVVYILPLRIIYTR